MQQDFSRKEKYSIIRFIALEYAMKNGPYAQMYLYTDPYNSPLIITTEKKNVFQSAIKPKHMPVKHILLYCLYNEYKVEQHLGLLLRITRMLDKKTDLEYAKKLGMDVSTYRMLESQTLENKGLIKRNSTNRQYQFNPTKILQLLDIPSKELEINLEDYNE